MVKTLISSLLCLSLAVPATAQGSYGYRRPALQSSYTQDHEVYYGLRLGLALARVGSDDPQLDGGSLQGGLNVGGIIGFQLSPTAPVYLESGLLYSQKGGKGYLNNSSATTSYTKGKKFTFDLNYLEVPIVAKYLIDLEDDITVQPFFGGYLAIGVAGNMKDYGEREERSAFSDDYFKRFDGGIRLGCGVQYQVMYAEMAYDWGLANIGHDAFGSSHTGCLSLNVGVNF